MKVLLSRVAKMPACWTGIWMGIKYLQVLSCIDVMLSKRRDSASIQWYKRVVHMS